MAMICIQRRRSRGVGSGQVLWGLIALLCFAIAYMWQQGGGVDHTSKVEWRTDWYSAMKESQTSGKRVVVDFTASWCPACKAMKGKWEADDVAKVARERYVPVMGDVDRSDMSRVAQQFGVRQIPTVIILNSDGQVIRQAHYMNEGDLLAFLER